MVQPIFLLLLFASDLQFMMANGTLVRVLIHTDVTKYLMFKAVDGSYVFNKGKVNYNNLFSPALFSCYVGENQS